MNVNTKRDEKRGLVASVRIGTIHGRMNFKLGENAFHASDVNKQNKEKKLQVKMESKPDIIGLRKQGWNNSTDTGDHVPVRRGKQIAKQDPTTFNYNYRAEVLPKSGAYIPPPGRHHFDTTKLHANYDAETMSRVDRPKIMEELEVHPSLRDKPQWNGSTEVDHQALERRDQQLTTRAKKFSKAKNRTLARNGYVDPKTAQEIRMEKLREEKERRLNGETIPSSNKESKVEDEIEMVPENNSKQKTKSRKYREYYNDGVYEYNKIEGCYMWSCSSNTNADFRGSCYRVRNPDSWNFASP